MVRSLIYGVLTAVLAVAILVQAVPAQAAAVTIDLTGISEWLKPIWDGIIAVILPVVALYIAKKVKEWFDIDIQNQVLSMEAKHREALQSAFSNSAGLLLMKIGNQGKVSFEVKNDALAAAAQMVINSVPDAVKFFGLTPEAIKEKILAKVPVIAPDVAANMPAPAPAPKPVL